MTGQGVPRRPAANPLRVSGTTLKRGYRAPEADERISPGDIVEYDHHRWDVQGWSSLPDEREPGGVRTTLVLQRRVKGSGGRIITAHPRISEVVLVGHQIMLPGLSPAVPPAGRPRPEDAT